MHKCDEEAIGRVSPLNQGPTKQVRTEKTEACTVFFRVPYVFLLQLRILNTTYTTIKTKAGR